MTAETTALWVALEVARKKLIIGGKNGAGNENTYAAIYQRLVRSGQALQLRAKYR